MGGAESTPERSPDELLDDVDMPPDKRRNLRRNFNMLSDANQLVFSAAIKLVALS